VRTPEFQAFSLEDDPGGLWIGEEDGRLVGSAFAWACDDFWFLAELFVSPDLQAKGIGNQLLRRALNHANAKGARNRALITFTFNRASQTLYIRHGIYPRSRSTCSAHRERRCACRKVDIARSG
jgi:GNAT superfamily N-acetyltransferase